MNTHEQYEELCALAASGQASAAELNDLRSHLEGCPSCRSAAYDFTQISAQGLSHLAARRLHCEIPSGMTQRFVARARSEGIEISRENVAPIAKPRRTRVFASVCAVAAVIVLAAFLVVARQRSSSIAASPQPNTPPPVGRAAQRSIPAKPPKPRCRNTTKACLGGGGHRLHGSHNPEATR